MQSQKIILQEMGGRKSEKEDAFKREIQHINYEKIGFNKLIKIGGVL